jgi:hypothetical protein
MRNIAPRILIGLTIVAISLLLSFETAKAGVAILISKYAVVTNRLDAANLAVELSPFNWQTFESRSRVLQRSGRLNESIKDLERATQLSPRKYGTWLKLGRAREAAKDIRGAEHAYRQAIKLAPYYAKSHWELGNLLLRSKRHNESFKELNIATQSDPKLFRAFIDLAWTIHNGDTAKIESAIDTRDDHRKLELANFYFSKKRFDDSVRVLLAASPRGEYPRFIDQFLVQKEFRAAHKLWLASNPGRNFTSSIYDGGFELDPGQAIDFNWSYHKDPSNIQIEPSFDVKKAGNRSLHIRWEGNSNPGTALVSQVLIVEPGQSYRFTLYAKTVDMLTGGLPSIGLYDAVNREPVSSSITLEQNSQNWKLYQVEFSTSPETDAVRLEVKRNSCNGTTVCPAFGDAWLDEFRLEKIAPLTVSIDPSSDNQNFLR